MYIKIAKRYLILLILSCLICGVFSGCAVEYYSDADSYSVGNATLSDEVTSLDISWVSGSVEISAYDGEEIELQESNASKDAEKMRYRLKNGKLTIHFRDSGVHFASRSKTLQIRIPYAQAEKLSSIEIEASAADITLTSLTAQKLSLETASGNITATECNFSKTELETASGNVKLHGSIGQFECESASGNIKLTSDITPSKMDIESASGNIHITIPSDSQFTCEYETAGGNISINGFSGNYKSDSFVCGSSKNHYDIEAASGNITLNAQ